MITLVIGGARSGKSAVAEARARAAAGTTGSVTYVATMRPDPGDPDLGERLSEHRRRRPSTWRTVEPPYDLPSRLVELDGVVLVDSLGPWLAALPGMHADHDALVGALRGRSAPTIVVTDEVGWGVHPETALGRRFRDAMGALNQALSAAADESLLVVAGRVVRLDEP